MAKKPTKKELAAQKVEEERTTAKKPQVNSSVRRLGGKVVSD